jgi:hypothetical protein
VRRTYYYWRATGARLREAPGTPEFEREIAAMRVLGVARTENVEYVYFIRSTATGAIKIGKSVDPMKRLNALQVATAEPVELLGCMPDVLGGKLERDVQGRFKKLHVRGEWFRAEPALLSFIARKARVAVSRAA